MKKIKLDVIAGTRPNFVKIAALYSALSENAYLKDSFACRLIHTGQHYDKNMSESFFQQLNIPEPDLNFGVGAGTHSEQTDYARTGDFNRKNRSCVVVVMLILP